MLDQGAQLPAGMLQANLDWASKAGIHVVARLIPRHAHFPAQMTSWASHVRALFGPAWALHASSAHNLRPTPDQVTADRDHQRLLDLWDQVAACPPGTRRLALDAEATTETHTRIAELTRLDNSRDHATLLCNCTLANALMEISEPIAACRKQAEAFADNVHLGSLRDAVMAQAKAAVARGDLAYGGILQVALDSGMPANLRAPHTGLRLQDSLEAAAIAAVRKGAWQQAVAAQQHTCCPTGGPATARDSCLSPPATAGSQPPARQSWQGAAAHLGKIRNHACAHAACLTAQTNAKYAHTQPWVGPIGDGVQRQWPPHKMLHVPLNLQA